MLATPDQRTQLADPTPTPASIVALEVAFIGLSNGLDAIASPAAIDTAPLDDASRVAIKAALNGAKQLGIDQLATDQGLEGLPLVFDGAAGFAAAFPGDDSWLVRAVRDYFAAGGQRAWVVRISGDEDAARTRALEIAMAIPSAGLVLAPDLEHSLLAAIASPPPAPAPPPPGAVFRPAAEFVLAPQPPRQADAQAPLSSGEAIERVQTALRSVNDALAARRRDMVFLFALPIGADLTQSIPALAKRTEAYLKGTALSQTQVFAPLLRDPVGGVASPSARIAGRLAQAAQTTGVWRSLAGLVLPLGGVPLRRIESNVLATLRDLGVVVLRYVGSGAALDDDILAVPLGSDRFAGALRLRGWLMRSLESLGEALVFENQLDDGRVELALTNFFAQLLRLGALDGRQTTDAFRVVSYPQTNGRAQFDIYLAIANAIETIRLQFVDGEVTAALGGAP
jgi:hypothetical protein